MHVGLVTSRYPPRTGGVETHVHELATRLVDRGHTVTVVSADAGADVPATSVREGVVVRRVHSFGPDELFHAAPSVLTRVCRSDFDVVHAHNYHSFPMSLAAFGARVPVVCTPHYHGESADPLRDRLLSLFAPIGGRALRTADAVVAVSAWESDRLAADFGVSARVVRNGVETDRFQDAPTVERDDPTLLTVGRLVEYKGVQHVIRALDRLPEFRLRVAGDGPYRDRLEATARSVGVSDRVEFLGYVPAEALPTEYASADVFVSMSSVEAAGITVGEALAAGTPAVVRPSKGLRDWAGRDDCVSVEPESLPTAVRRVRLRDAPSEPLPTWEQATDDLEQIYRRLVE